MKKEKKEKSWEVVVPHPQWLLLNSFALTHDQINKCLEQYEKQSHTSVDRPPFLIIRSALLGNQALVLLDHNLMNEVGFSGKIDRHPIQKFLKKRLGPLTTGRVKDKDYRYIKETVQRRLSPFEIDGTAGPVTTSLERTVEEWAKRMDEGESLSVAQVCHDALLEMAAQTVLGVEDLPQKIKSDIDWAFSGKTQLLMVLMPGLLRKFPLPILTAGRLKAQRIHKYLFDIGSNRLDHILSGNEPETFIDEVIQAIVAHDRESGTFTESGPHLSLRQRIKSQMLGLFSAVFETTGYVESQTLIRLIEHTPTEYLTRMEDEARALGTSLASTPYHELTQTCPHIAGFVRSVLDTVTSLPTLFRQATEDLTLRTQTLDANQQSVVKETHIRKGTPVYFALQQAVEHGEAFNPQSGYDEVAHYMSTNPEYRRALEAVRDAKEKRDEKGITRAEKSLVRLLTNYFTDQPAFSFDHKCLGRHQAADNLMRLVTVFLQRIDVGTLRVSHTYGGSDQDIESGLTNTTDHNIVMHRV